jgi:hypothetical protein
MLWDEGDTLEAAARKADAAQRGPVSIDDFWAYMPMHSYIYAPSREMWPASSVNARIEPIPLLDAAGNPVHDKRGRKIKIKASDWLDQHHAVEQMTWAPGEAMLIKHRLISEGGWIERAGCTIFNLYRMPQIDLGDPAEAYVWLNHIQKVFPNTSNILCAGSHTACSAPKIRSTTRSYSAARKALVKTLYWSR